MQSRNIFIRSIRSVGCSISPPRRFAMAAGIWARVKYILAAVAPATINIIVAVLAAEETSTEPMSLNENSL